jgi:hypothetical protein
VEESFSFSFVFSCVVCSSYVVISEPKFGRHYSGIGCQSQVFYFILFFVNVQHCVMLMLCFVVNVVSARIFASVRR